ncbi:Hypothetical protein GLP15_5086 [Giardia lamblia P15]|uniref:Uncharacterized protein n=1 Tax=Giardia intestinalis (strain P15) TaxID=658858 RepID=E1F7F8_GIAIA|nr:Hypothetical protein GLP15_5086 [Giardia lamblia P15]
MNAHNMVLCPNMAEDASVDRSSTRQRELLPTFFSSLPAPILTHRVHSNCLTCLLLNGELYRLFRDDSGRTETELVLRLPLFNALLTAGCFAHGSNDIIVVCSIVRPLLDSSLAPVPFDSQISIYYHQKKQYSCPLPGVVIKECIPRDGHIVLLGHEGEVFFYNCTGDSLTLIKKFSNSHDLAVKLLIHCEKLFRQSSFNVVCRLLMLNVATTPLCFVSSPHLFLLYQNGALLVLHDLSVTLYALLQPHQLGTALAFSAFCSDKQSTPSKTSSVVRPTTISSASGYLFVGFANGFLSVYTLEQIKDDMSHGKLATQPIISFNTLELHKSTHSISTTVHTDDDQMLHKGVSALHPVYLWDTAICQPRPESQHDDDDNTNIYLTELSNQAMTSTTQDVPGPFSHFNLYLLVAVNNSVDVFLLKLFPQHGLKLILTYERPVQLQMLAVNITQVLFLTNSGFTQALYVQLSNGSIFRLMLPAHVLLYSALKPPPPRASHSPNKLGECGISDDDNDINDVDIVSTPLDKPLSTVIQPPRHPFISSTKNLEEMVVNSSKIIADLFPYGQHYSANSTGATSVDKLHPAGSFITKQQNTSLLNALLTDTQLTPSVMPASRSGQATCSLPSSHTGPAGPCFTNLLTQNSPLVAQVTKRNNSALKSLERHATRKISKAIPNEKVYHQVILTPATPVRSRFVLNFLPTGNPVLRLLDGTISKPKPILAQVNALFGGFDAQSQVPVKHSNHAQAKLSSLASQLSINKSTRPRPSSPPQLRRSHLLNIELPIPSFSAEGVKSKQHHLSVSPFTSMRKVTNNSITEHMLPLRDTIDLGARILPISSKDGSSIDELFLSHLESHDLSAESTGTNRFYTPFDPLRSLSVYRHSDFCKKNGDLRLIYPHKRFMHESEDSFSCTLNVSIQSEDAMQECSKRSQSKNIWTGSLRSRHRYRAASVQFMADSHLHTNALNVTPAKIYTHLDNSRKRWLSKYFTTRRHDSYGFSTSKAGHHEKGRPAHVTSFFVVNLNDLFANAVAKQILKINVSPTNTTLPQPSTQTLASKLPKKIGIEDTSRTLDEHMGYEVLNHNEEKQPNLGGDRRLLTSKSGIWESSTIVRNLDNVVGNSKPCESGYLLTDPIIPPTVATDQIEALSSQVITDSRESCTNSPPFETPLETRFPMQSVRSQILLQEQRSQIDAVPASSQLHDPRVLVDEAGNLIMFSTPISPILSDIIKDGTLRPVVDGMEDLSHDSIDEPLALKPPGVFRPKLFDSQEDAELGISLDLFPHDKVRISHNKYDLLSICTYRGPLPQIDDDTKRFLEVMEQRSKYHLDADDPGSSFVLTESHLSAQQSILKNLELYRQTISTMSVQLQQADLKKDRVHQLYREVIRRILNNIDRLCEQDCIKKVTLGNNKYYSLKKKCVIDYSSSEAESLSQDDDSETDGSSECCDNSENSFAEESVLRLEDSPFINPEEHHVYQGIPKEALTEDSSILTFDKLNTSLSKEGSPGQPGQASNSFLINTTSINEPSISNIDAKSAQSPKHCDVIADYSSDSFKDPSKQNYILSVEDSESSSPEVHVFERHGRAGDPSQRHIIHRDRTKVLFDIYAEDQEYSDTDPIYTEDNPKYVPLVLTAEQYKTLFHLDPDLSRRLRRMNVSDVLSLYTNTIDCQVEPQLWFMKTGYIFSPLEDSPNLLVKYQSAALRNALSFQQVRTNLTLGDTAEHHTYEDMASLLTAALPDGEDSEEARIPEETSEDLDPNTFEENISALAYEDLTPDQKLRYLLNEPYVDATHLYLSKTLDELGYFMQKRNRDRQKRTNYVEESIFDLMANGLGFTKPRMPDNYISGNYTRKHRVDQAYGKLLSFTTTPHSGCLSGLGRTEYVDPVAANQLHHSVSAKQASKDPSNTESDVLVRDYKRSYYYHNPLINLLQCYYLVRSYAALNAYFSRHLVLTEKVYTRPKSAPSWLGKKRKEQSILDLWEEAYGVVPSKVLWDSTLALKRASPTRQFNVDHATSRPQLNSSALNFLRTEVLTNSIRNGHPLNHRKALTIPYIHTFFNSMRWKGIEYRQAIAEMSKANLYSTEVADLFAKLYKIERLETEKHLKDLYDVANRTGNAKLYGLCINVMLFRPYLKRNPFKSVLAGVNSLVDDDTSTGSNSVSSVLSPRQPLGETTIEGLSDTFTCSSAASLLLKLQEKRKKEQQESKRKRALETNTKALMFELKAGTAVDISNISIPFDMRFDYKDLRPGRCYFCAGVFIEIPFLPPYKFEKDNDLEEDFRGVVDKQLDIWKESTNTHAHGSDGKLTELEELIKRADKIGNESVTLFDIKFLYTMYPILYTNLTELLLSKRIKRMDVNSDISDISKLITNFATEEHFQKLDPNIQGQEWKSVMSDSFCSLPASEVESYTNSINQVATEVIAKVTDLDIYLNASTARDLDQPESPLRSAPLAQQTGQPDLVDNSPVLIDKSDFQPTPPLTLLADSGMNIAELSPDNRVLPTGYKNIMDLQTDYVFETNYKYYEHIAIQSTINDRVYRLGLMPIKAVIRDILFECLASLPPFARFIAKKLVENGNVFHVEELQMLPFVLLQAQLLYRPARDLLIYLRHAMKKIHLLEVQKIQRKAIEEENFIPTSSKDDALQNDQDSATNALQPGPNASWRILMYRPCSQLLDFDGSWGDKRSDVNTNKRLFNYCILLLYHTRLAAGRTRQLMIWKLRQIAKRDKGGFQKGDAFAEVASKYNNIATSTAAHNNLVEAARFSTFYEDTLNDFSGIVAMGRRASPVVIYLRRLKNQFVCLYEDFSLRSSASGEYVANIRFAVLEDMRREAQIHAYAVLRIYGYKYMDDALLGIQSNSLLLVYPLSLIINIHTLCTMSSDLIARIMHSKAQASTDASTQVDCNMQSESFNTKDLSSHSSAKNIYNFTARLFMMFIKHHVNRIRSGYSFLIYVAATLYQDVTETHLAHCFYNLTLFELKLRMDNSYVVDWPRLTVLLGSFNTEMLAEWLEITFKNVFMTTRNAAKKDIISYLQKQQTMISALVSFVAHDEHTACFSNASICAKGELSIQTDQEEDSPTLCNAASAEIHTEAGVDVPLGLIEGMRQISSPTHHERLTKATDELLKIDRDQFDTDDMLERAQRCGNFATTMQRGNVDAMRAELDFRMNELKIILDNQEASSNAADYEITEVRDERQADEMGEQFIEYAISKQLTEKLRVIRRDLSPTSFRTDESMDLVTPMRELREQYIKIESIKRQHEMNEMLRLSSTESPEVRSNLSSILKNAEETTQKLAQNVNDIRIRGSSMSTWRNQIKHMIQKGSQKHLGTKHFLDSKIAGADSVPYLKGDTCVRSTDYILTSDVQLPSGIQGTVKRMLTPQPRKMGGSALIKQLPASTVPRRPCSILGHIQSNSGINMEMRTCSPPPPGSTIFSSDLYE